VARGEKGAGAAGVAFAVQFVHPLILLPLLPLLPPLSRSLALSLSLSLSLSAVRRLKPTLKSRSSPSRFSSAPWLFRFIVQDTICMAITMPTLCGTSLPRRSTTL